MTFEEWIKINNPNIPECGPNYMILQQLWFSGQTQALVDPKQVNETLLKMSQDKKNNG